MGLDLLSGRMARSMGAIEARTTEDAVDYVDGLRVFQKMGVAQGKKGVLRSLFTWMLVVGLAVMLLMLLQRPPRAGGRAMVPAESIWNATTVVALIAYMLLFCATFVLARIAVRQGLRRHGRENRGKPVVYTISDAGLGVDSSFEKRMYHWAFFDRFGESEKSVVLRGKGMERAQTVFLTVPKSAFASPDELAAFMTLVQANVLPEAAVHATGQWVQV